MVKDLVSFSDCGQYFVHCGSDGKLKVWDTVTGNLKQEYVPNLSLNSPCTCLTWLSLSGKQISQNQKRKRKLKGKTIKVIAIGTNEGAIAMYSLSESEVVVTLRDGNSSILGLSWSRDAGLFSVDGTHVTQWDLETKSVKSKWNCKGTASRVAVSPSGNVCVTGNININLWDVNTKKCLKSLMGHSNELSNLMFIDDHYFLSCGINERHIVAWTTSGEDDTPIGRFSLGDSLRGEISVLVEDNSLKMIATTSDGSLLYFSQQLNGKVTKAIKPLQRIELVNNECKGEVNSTTPVPVVCGKLRTSSTISAAYGYGPIFGFEVFSISLESTKQVISVLKPNDKHVKIVSTNVQESADITGDVEYTTRIASTGAVKRKLGNNEVTMEERLGNLCLDLKDSSGLPSTSTHNPHNFSQLLMQGLDSKDKTILQSVLLRRDPVVINETVTRLPVHALSPLIHELKNMMHGRALASTIATEWLRAVLRHHSSQLLADPSIQEHLNFIQSTVEARLCLMGALGSLSGRLGHLLQQIDSDQDWRTLADSFEPVVLYQEKDSSDEGDSLGEGDYESEDKWEELSDQIDSETSS